MDKSEIEHGCTKLAPLVVNSECKLLHRWKVSYPKFKNGQATIKNVLVTQNFDYVTDLFETFTSANKEQLHLAREELEEMTPSPMNTILEKQRVAEAVEKRNLRKSMEVVDVPATTSGNTGAGECSKRTRTNKTGKGTRQSRRLQNARKK
ncbi:hypothetical protein AC249_AIPGENE15633 [Exaiptasia diaphana]|nr:hypothetical protein AC249_AIPGENE15633 [Exaiptasia diaphana]